MSKETSKSWTRDELILTINLYCKTPFGKIHIKNPDIIELAELLGRTPGSVSYKLANFASIDSSLDRKGASNVSNLDKEVWKEFYDNWNEMAFKSEAMLAKAKGKKVEISEDITMPMGVTKGTLVKIRVNQSFFRRMILSTYENRCCITGINLPQLLVASHIVPWATDQKNQINPRNGLCLNSLHDKAFDTGLITLDESYSVVLSSKLRVKKAKSMAVFLKYDGKTITLPKRFIPDQTFLSYHRERIFIQ